MQKLFLLCSLLLALSVVTCADGVTTRIATGTGFVLSPDGFILTNEHVVHGTTTITVTVGGEDYIASVIQTDPAKDLALIKIDAHDLSIVPVGDSDHVSIGDAVYAIGCPTGICGTLSSGSVANLRVPRPGLEVTCIMMDLTLTHGNSGGPLLNAEGSVIGVTTRVLLSSLQEDATETGYSFAVPINAARELLALVPGVSKTNQGTAALSPQAIRDRLGAAVAYIENRFEVPLENLVTRGIPSNYGDLLPTQVWTRPSSVAADPAPTFLLGVGVLPVSMAWATSSGKDGSAGTAQAQVVVALLEDEAAAATAAESVMSAHLAGTGIVEKGTFQAGTIAAPYCIGFYVTDNILGVLSTVLRATVTVTVGDLLCAVSVVWRWESWEFPPVSYPGYFDTHPMMRWDYGTIEYSDGCVLHYPPRTSTARVLICREAFLSDLKALLGSELAALSNALSQ